MADETLRARCRDYAARINPARAVTRAVELIEELAVRAADAKNA